MITRNEILAKLPAIVSVSTIAWGAVRVRQIAGDEFASLWAIIEGQPGIERLAKLTVLGLCDEEGKPLLRAEDERKILHIVEPLTKVADAFLELNGVSMLEKKPSDSPIDSSTRSENVSALPTPLPVFPEYPSGS